MKKDLKEYYELVSYRRLIDYLLLKHNVNDELDKFKDIILTEEFLVVLKLFISDINKYGAGYPEISKENAFKIVNYIKLNSNLYNSECIDEINKMNKFSYDKYYYEYTLKQSSINLESYQNTALWNVEDIEESLLYDFIVTMSLNTDDMDFLNNYLNNFIFSKNTVLSLNKIVSENDKLLSDKEIKRRIRTIVKSNLKLLDNIDENNRREMIELYVSKNYKVQENVEFYIHEFDIFKELNLNALNKLSNNKYNAFNIESIHQYYDYLVIENYLNADSNIKSKDLILNNIYFYIDNVLSLSLNNKKQLIGLLNEKKEFLTSFELEKLNSYIEKINLKTTNKDNDIIYEFKTRSNMLTFIKAKFDIKKGDNALYNKVLASKSQDLYNIEMLIKDDEYFNKNIMYANMLSFQYSLKKFMSEYPSMFLNDVILSRALTIINKYDGLDAKVLKKKLEKIKKA